MVICRRSFGLLGVFLGLVSLLGGEGIQLNMTAPEVEMAVGRPTSQLARGEREIWNYPDGGQVILEGGLVVSFKNLPEATIEKSLPEEEAPVATEIANEVGPVEPVEESAAEAEDAANNAAAMEDFSDVVEELETLHQEAPRAMQEAMMPLASKSGWGAVLAEALFSMILSVLVLKVAFKWSDIDSEWKQMILPAAANVVTATAVIVGAKLALGTSEVFYLDHALSYVVLVLVLQRTTHASSLARAVSVAGVTKVASIVLLSILSVFVL